MASELRQRFTLVDEDGRPRQGWHTDGASASRWAERHADPEDRLVGSDGRTLHRYGSGWAPKGGPTW